MCKGDSYLLTSICLSLSFIFEMRLFFIRLRIGVHFREWIWKFTKRVKRKCVSKMGMELNKNWTILPTCFLGQYRSTMINYLFPYIVYTKIRIWSHVVNNWIFDIVYCVKFGVLYVVSMMSLSMVSFLFIRLQSNAVLSQLYLLLNTCMFLVEDSCN